MEELVEKFEKWKKGLEEKGLRVNTAKSKVMISSIAAKCDLVVGKWPCAVLRKGVGSNSIFCQTCKHWVHKKCSSISGRLRADIQFVCKRCKGEIIENEVFPALLMYNSGSLEIFEKWKKGLEEKGLRVNTAKSKVMISSIAAKCDLVVGKWPCAVLRKGVGSNSIFCQTCKHWVHKKCSSISGRLRADIQFVCKRCKGEIIENEVFPALLMYNSGSLEIVEKFCYLGDMLGSEGGVGRSVTCRIGSAWKKFRELLPLSLVS
ncbi:uncharacterized protein LOC130654010 [Hydractinia symbiolongicarpus]|uniref:uncharacterized protein LOC130654010 n=1 Tax=Hydractinia symbiolongicarpus TaxID=13093 RepID=UPI00254AC23E|nr:uncharacterized protein LOC130654010 [Hydractinia symbiolongicarpus]